MVSTFTSDTPILDRTTPLPAVKRPRWPIAVGFASGAIIALAILYFQAYGGVSRRLPTFVYPLLFALFLQLSVAIHEFAHLLAGRFTGFYCRGVTVCCYSVMRTILGWRFIFRWKNILAGGGAYMVTLDPNPRDWQLGLMTAAGPVANVALLAAVALVPLPLWASSVRWPACLGAGVTAVVSLLPIGTGSAVSDAAVIIVLLRGGGAWRRWRAVLCINSLNLQGVPPREWDASGLDEAASVSGGSGVAWFKAGLLAYTAACDRGEFANAARYLESTLALSPKATPAGRNLIFLEAAFFQARRRRDAAAARAWMSDVRPKGVPEESIATAEAAVLLVEGRCAEAGEKASSALERLQGTYVDAATVRQTIKGLKEILDEAACSDQPGASPRIA